MKKCPPKLSATQTRGFTLFEMVIVLLLVGITVGIAVPRFADSLHTARLDALSKRIVSDLATAQARARATSGSQTVAFTLAPSADQYQIVGMPDPDRNSATYTVPISAAPYFATLRAVDCGGDSKLIFNGYGIPDSGGTVTIKVGDYTRTLSIDADTGEATVP